jgi:hypothetical protein
MRFVVRTGPGVVELNWMWLPTFLGHDAHLKKRLDDALQPLLVGKSLDDETLDVAHEKVIDIICETHKAIPSLRDYLDAVKFVTEKAT